MPLHKEAAAAINEHGAKNGLGPLLYDKAPDLRDNILQVTPFSIAEGLSGKIVDEISTGLFTHEAHSCIVRVGVPGFPGDWGGGVDLVPTTRGVEPHKVREIVDGLREELERPQYKAFLEKEGTPFDIEKLSVTVAPEIPGDQVMLTEHPNRDNVTMVDMVGNWGTPVLDFEGDRILYPNPSRIEGRDELVARESLRIMRAVRETGQFPDEGALQIELVVKSLRAGLAAFLTQVKYFADRRYANFSLEGRKPGSARNFGVTKTKEGVILPLKYSDSRGDSSSIDAEMAGEEYLFMPRSNFEDLTPRELPMSMAAYLPFISYHRIEHKATRYIQRALMHENGCAFLDSEWAPGPGMGDLIRNAAEVRIIADGIRHEIEIV
jgi:hypothetical protein